MRNLEGGSSVVDFERWMKGALGMRRLSLKGLTAEGLEGPWVMKGWLWRQASLHGGSTGAKWRGLLYWGL